MRQICLTIEKVEDKMTKTPKIIFIIKLVTKKENTAHVKAKVHMYKIDNNQMDETENLKCIILNNRILETIKNNDR